MMCACEEMQRISAVPLSLFSRQQRLAQASLGICSACLSHMRSRIAPWTCKGLCLCSVSVNSARTVVG